MLHLDIQLTEHFTLREMCKSETAARQQIPNIPLPCHISKMKNLLENSVEPARQHFGVPFRVTSGYRCEAVNKLVGGVGNSQHRLGEAVDFQVGSGEASLEEVWAWMRDHVVYDQLILEYGRWIHVSLHIDPKLNRHQAFKVKA